MGELSRTDIGTVNKAEEIEQGNSWDNVEIDLQAKSCFCSRVKVHERVTISETAVSDLPRGRNVKCLLVSCGDTSFCCLMSRLFMYRILLIFFDVMLFISHLCW